MKSNRVFYVCLIAMGIMLGCKPPTEGKDKQGAKEEEAVKGAVNVDLYVMSKCPYGVRALDAMIPAVEKIGKAANLKIEYIGRKGPDGTVTSMHGPAEVEGNIAQLCAEKAGRDTHFAFITCMNKEWKDIPKNWESCAKEVGLDMAQLKACKDGNEGKTLFADSVERSIKAKAQGSPTIHINGKPYQGGRSEKDFLRGICQAFEKDQPKACKDIPPPAKVNMTVLTDKRCKTCNAEQLVKNLEGVFPGLDAKILDWSDDAAKAIAKEADVKLLPAVLFDDTVKADEDGMQRVGRFLQPAGKYQSLRVGAKFDPTAEICDNGQDDTGNGKVDCADETCSGELMCREEKPGRLDVFVMSQCPYGVMALDAMKDVLKAFGDEMDFNINYIANELPDGSFKALHGQPEVDENIRELCAIKHYPKKYKYMDYIWCRNENIRDADWKKCTGKNGIDTAVIEKCFTGPEGKKLHSESIKKADELKITGSPTWLANNNTRFSGVAAKDIQKKFCEKNDKLKGCGTPIEASSKGPTPQGSCN